MPEIWTIQKVLKWTLEYFQKNHVPEARLGAEILLANILNIKRLDLYLQFDRILTSSELKQYREYIQRRIQFEPIQYIIGTHEFMGLNFKVTPDVFIPRPETELLVEHAIHEINKMQKKVRIIDIGTGSGVIAICISYFCSNSIVTAVDISQEALKIAEENSQKNGQKNIKFVKQDIFKNDLKLLGEYDFTITNPPYVSEAEKDKLHDQVSKYEPTNSLYAGKDGLDFYRKLIPVSHSILADNGYIFMEIGYNQKEKIEKILEIQQFRNIQFIKDYHKKYRVIKAQK